MAATLKRIATSQLSVWALITVFGVYFLSQLKQKLNFGIDLVGGTYITLKVQTDVAYKNTLYNRALAASRAAQKAGIISEPLIPHATATEAEVTCASTAVAQQIANLPESQGARADGNRLSWQLSEKEREHIQHATVESNRAVLRNRLDATGVGEVGIAVQGNDAIIIELPNVHDPAQAKKMIGTSALLEIKVVEDSGKSPEDILQRFGGSAPEGYVIVPSRERAGHKLYYLVAAHTDVTGELLQEARAALGGGDFGNEPFVEFAFNSAGADLFHDMTSQNIGRQIAIIIDGVAISAPVVKSAINGRGSITGSKDFSEAQELATFLNSGAFAAPVVCVEERSIGPTLGAESIHQGIVSCGIAVALLLLFSLVVYKVAGLFAAIVLIYNLLLILFMMSWLGATLTMPGIAGIVLTIGMAIDASILIFEKIKEELAAGSGMRAAVESGFSGALAVILDANITHLLVSAVLYKLGTGPIQGFAVTMIVGIISTLITGILLLKALFNFSFDVLGVRTIKM